MNVIRSLAAGGAASIALACAPVPGVSTPAALRRPACDTATGITLPAGFCATIVADLGVRARHIAVAPNGDVFVATYGTAQAPSAGVVLRDTTGDGRADVTSRFGSGPGGSGIALRPGRVWFATNSAVLRYRWPQGALAPAGAPDTIVSGLPADRSHTSKTIAVGADGRLFVNIGSPSNSCQVADRRTASPGQDPCPELETRAGIWVFDADRIGQTQSDGRRYATGIRNAVAITLHPSGTLFAAQHGRDQLAANWPALYTDEQSAELPAEELLRVTDGADFGWPYCFYDGIQRKRVLAPEYGGDGRATGRCERAALPTATFPGHWAPNAIVFYDGGQFPERYRGGAFIAFHGSWNRAPLPQAGYNVTFVPFRGESSSGDYEVFADGFAGAVREPQSATYRPTGLAVGPDGSLYVTDTRKGRVWRITWRG